MENTAEKIKDGTIRIENGKLVGLGIAGRNSIDVSALNELLGHSDKQDIVEVLTNTITGIGRIYAVLLNCPEGPVYEFCDNWIRVPLPDDSDLFSLGQILKFFNK